MFFQPPEISEEQLEKMQDAFERNRMKQEEIQARIRRLIAEELSFEQLEALDHLLAHIANSQNPSVVANWYEGQTTGALAVRDLRLGEKQVELP